VPFRIIVDVFSGRQNPGFELDDDRVRALLKRRGALVPLDAKDAGAVPAPLLGYRGVLVEETEEHPAGRARRFRLATADVRGKARQRRGAREDTEDVLFGPAGLLREEEAGSDLVRILREDSWRAPARAQPRSRTAAVNAAAAAAVSANLVEPGCDCAPVYEPQWWNDGSIRQLFNNCYNYSTNYRTDTFAQPGRASGLQFAAFTSAAVRAAATRDNLILTPTADNQCPAEGHLVALVVAPGFDFHWYRKGRDGMWTHKPGPNMVTHLDNAGQPIMDPRTADRGPYTSFSGFMVARHGHIKLQ
jgi:hypothetical protein